MLKAERKLTGELQKDFDNEVIRRTDKYVPVREGDLRNSVKTATVLGSGTVVYKKSYAKKQYYSGGAPGKSKKGKFRGRFWFERMKLDNKAALERFIAAKTGGKPTNL